jgi:hypothetical protein
MLIIARGINRNRLPAGQTVSASILGILSTMAKEEFALPMLILLSWSSLRASDGIRNRIRCLLVIQILGIVGTIVLQRLSGAGFTANSGAYGMNFSFSSIVTMFSGYLLVSPGATIALVSQILSFIAVMIFGSKFSKERTLILQLLILALIFPFTLLPNHFCPFYAVDWIPWQSASLLWLTPVIGNNPSLLSRLASTGVVLGLTSTVAFLTYPERARQIQNFSVSEAYAKNVLDTIRVNRRALNSYPDIAVIGAKLTGPWSWPRGDYFKLRLGISTKWLVFVPTSSELYVLVREVYGSLPTDNVQILSLSDLPNYPNAPRLVLNPMGGGRIVLPPGSPKH